MNKIKCPDCKKELTEVIVERYQTKTFLIQGEKVIPKDDSAWESDDFSYRCPFCDSLNVDELVRGKVQFKDLK